VILDSLDQKPVPYATVYINNTTKGTITNINGEFSLENVSASSLLVVSHISYNTFFVSIEYPILDSLILFLKPRELNIQEVNVKDRNLRSINLTIFRNWLLGTDQWGKGAKIINYSVLFFYPRYLDEEHDSTERIQSQNKSSKLRSYKDSLAYFSERIVSLKVEAKAPVQIDMPLLGQRLHYNMVDFLLTAQEANAPEQIDMPLQGKRLHYNMVDFKLTAQNKKQRSCHMLGYYYFEPYSSKTIFADSTRKRNRKKAYYHSIQHFCKSLYNNTLSQNGYRLQFYNQELKANQEFSADSLLDTAPDGTRLICGRKGQNFTIWYLGDSQDRPVDITKDQSEYASKKSGLQILSDTCIIRSDGSIPNNRSLSFNGDISQKRLGSFLPFDYNPDTD